MTDKLPYARGDRTDKPPLQVLRRQLAGAENPPRAWPARPLGVAQMDEALCGEGLDLGALHEIFPAGPGDFAAALGFGLGVLARLLRARPGFVLWAVPAYQMREEGQLYPLGLEALGLTAARLIHLCVPKPKDMLWALEEGLGHKGMTAVVGVLPAADTAYDFTASRRLALRAAQHGVTPFLIGGCPGGGAATAAQTRWSVGAGPSRPQPHPGRSRPGLGPPLWRVHLVKAKKGRLGSWWVEWDDEAFSFRLAAAMADRAAPDLSHAAGEKSSAIG